MRASRLLLACVALALSAGSPAGAMDAEREGLSAGTLAEIVYGEDHLTELPDTGEIVYEYTLEGEILEEPFHDTVFVHFKPSAENTPDDRGRHFDIDITVFPETGAQMVPTVSADTVNPIFLVFLQRDVNQMSRGTGGSVHYFRNLLRSAMNQQTEAETISVEIDGGSVEARRVTMMPFSRDQERRELLPYAEKTYSFTVSSAVPGHVVELRTTIPSDDGTGIKLRETYRFKELHQ